MCSPNTKYSKVLTFLDAMLPLIALPYMACTYRLPFFHANLGAWQSQLSCLTQCKNSTSESLFLFICNLLAIWYTSKKSKTFPCNNSLCTRNSYYLHGSRLRPPYSNVEYGIYHDKSQKSTDCTKDVQLIGQSKQDVTDKTTKDYYTGKNKKVYLQKLEKM